MLTQAKYNALIADLMALGYDNFSARITAATDFLAFSVDTIEHRMKRVAEHDVETRYNLAYAELGMDRKREHKRIAAELEATKVDGIWARSTKEYSVRCTQLDEWVEQTLLDGERFSHDIDEGLRA